ncbi:restriction endonuclease subunit S [Fructobacillus parabroussonetiae]|uniref:Restriction endonuclease subunit S n=1 Tax=Fructobacillus parabroussonetiae TaxID=2713174 RepID=A0ABS5QW21_9LACO|nr:restriction endonuclease subunit S [Fructobacillus parabroussonetiae]MBS9337335.1 restriction endonuclease subunit S [Fructobacillus parabroussonetiae]
MTGLKNDKKMVPNIRFKGFTDDWEQRKLSTFADRFDNLREPITAGKRVNGDIPYYGANGIQDYVDGYTHDGDFLLIAEDGASDLSNYPVRRVNGKVWVNNHAHVVAGKMDAADNGFLSNSFKTINIEPFLVGGGRAKLNSDVMMKLEFKLPEYQEQKEIGSLLDKVDNVLTLHQRKLEGLEKLKKLLLQKMFPQNGESVPELRFSGFTDDWEQRKLGELTTWSKGFELSKDKLNSEGVGSKALHYADLYKFKPVERDVIHWTTSEEGYDLKSNSLLFPMSDVTSVGLARTSYLTDNSVKIGGDVLIAELNKDTEAGFLSYQINAVPNKIIPFVTGTTIRHINSKSLSKIIYSITGTQEQKQIETILLSLGSLITLHQRKLEKLESVKKSLLQNLFV